MHIVPVRHRIIGLLAMFSLVAYLLRMNISVAAKFMMPELGLTQIQMGQVFSAFMVGYAIFQIPWGLLGDRAGPRIMLSVAIVSWVVTTGLTGLLPGSLVPGGTPAFVCLLALRFLLGVGQAALYPLAARTVANWMPATERAFGYSIIIAAAAAGSAFTGPLVAWCMVRMGWRASFYVCAALAALSGIIWHWYAADRPDAHPAIGRAELLLIRAGNGGIDSSVSSRSWFVLLRDRNIILICASYFLSSYVLFMFLFWFYLYLVDERKFSVLRGGVFTGMPYVLGLLAVPAAGYLSDRWCKSLGRSAGRRAVAMGAFAVSAAALFAGTHVNDSYLAIAALSVSVASMMSTEGPFWSATIDVGGRHSGAAGGIMNMAGNLGGVAATALFPVLVKYFGWGIALGSGSGLAVIGGLLWLSINPTRAILAGGEELPLVEEKIPHGG